MWTRRTIVWGAGAATALAGIGWGARGFLSKQYPPTPYDDVFAHLKDRDAAARIGREVLKGLPNLEPSAAANTVRSRLGHQSLQEAVEADVAGNRLTDAQGWILPETFALLGALAARVQAARN